MNLRIAHVRPGRAAWYGLIAAAALLSAVSLISLASRPAEHGELMKLLEEVRAPRQADIDTPAAARRPRRPSGAREGSQAAEQISQRNLFAPPAGPKKPPPPIAVLGHQAVFPKNEWVKVGGEYQGFKLLRIGPSWVEMEVDGKAVQVSVFAPKEGAQPPAEQAGPGQAPEGPAGDQEDRGRRFGGRRGFPVTPEMIERFRAMPPERRERILQNMPPEIRQQFEQ